LSGALQQLLASRGWAVVSVLLPPARGVPARCAARCLHRAVLAWVPRFVRWPPRWSAFVAMPSALRRSLLRPCRLRSHRGVIERGVCVTVPKLRGRSNWGAVRVSQCVHPKVVLPEGCLHRLPSFPPRCAGGRRPFLPEEGLERLVRVPSCFGHDWLKRPELVLLRALARHRRGEPGVNRGSAAMAITAPASLEGGKPSPVPPTDESVGHSELVGGGRTDHPVCPRTPDVCETCRF
jgi:hypothetical protein